MITTYLNFSVPYFFVFVFALDLNLQVLKRMLVVEQKQDAIVNDLSRLKAVLIKRTDEDVRNTLFECHKYDDTDAFEEFCRKLEDDNSYRTLFVSSDIEANVHFQNA